MLEKSLGFKLCVYNCNNKISHIPFIKKDIQLFKRQKKMMSTFLLGHFVVLKDATNIVLQIISLTDTLVFASKISNGRHFVKIG